MLDSRKILLNNLTRNLAGSSVFTISAVVCFHGFLHLPPMLGMMTGLSDLKFLGFYPKKTHNKHLYASPGTAAAGVQHISATSVAQCDIS